MLRFSKLFPVTTSTNSSSLAFFQSTSIINLLGGREINAVLSHKNFISQESAELYINTVYIYNFSKPDKYT